MNGGNKPLKYALLYGEAGYLVFPCRPGTKMPATRHGLHDASAEAGVIAAMFTDPDANIGLACGPQPNELNLLAVDVDAHKGGLESWVELCRGLPLPGAPVHETPNGGLHVFFDAPSLFRNSRERLGAGIDTRASGGYVVVPPSRIMVGSEYRSYRATEATALLTNRPPPVPDWLLALLEPQVDLQDDAEADLLPRSPLGEEWESPADWIRRVGDWPTELARFGWAHAHGEYWVRPGKDPRDGHSAVLHEGGPLVVFSTDVPRELEALGKVTADGAGFAVSLFDFITAYEFGGDRSASAREFRRLMPTAGSGYGQGPSPAVDVAPVSTAGSEPSVLNLPAEFWEARPVLSLIRTAAWSRLVSPDALLVNVLARSATLIPPSLKLPPIIGTEATFDFLGCVVAETSGGKSITAGVGRDLLPDPGRGITEVFDRSILFDMPIGSGEGIAQAFMVQEERPDDNGTMKRTGKQVVGRQALHFVVDESTGLVAQAQRKGTTIIPTLLSAWSGAPLGQLNASAETRRIVQGGRCRVAAVLNMQSSNAWMLFTDEMTTLGLTSRMLFAWAHDPSVPWDRDPWPGELSFPIPAGTGDFARYVTYADEIAGQIVSGRWGVVTGGVDDKTTGHTPLLRCKVSAILAVWDGRQDVTIDDWNLAGQVCEMSAAVLQMLMNLRSQQQRDQSHRTAMARGEAEIVIDDLKDRQKIDKLSQALVKKIRRDGSMGRSQLKKATTSSETRWRFDAALELAVSNGYLVEDEGRVSMA